jgi:hypothetical protein
MFSYRIARATCINFGVMRCFEEKSIVNVMIVTLGISLSK